jgi:putative endonuclease
MHNYYVYILTNTFRNVLYIGMTNNLERRIAEHKSGQIPGFTQKYKVTQLVHLEHTHSVDAAIQREKQLKDWRREKKDALVSSSNPEWRDLSLDWQQGEIPPPAATG